MGRRDPPGDAETEATTFHRFAVAGIAAEKWLTHARQGLRLNALAGVGDPQLRGAGGPAQPERDCSARLIVFHGIVREVESQFGFGYLPVSPRFLAF